jgi:hypothetical protein
MLPCSANEKPNNLRAAWPGTRQIIGFSRRARIATIATSCRERADQRLVAPFGAVVGVVVGAAAADAGALATDAEGLNAERLAADDANEAAEAEDASEAEETSEAVDASFMPLSRPIQKVPPRTRIARITPSNA